MWSYSQGLQSKKLPQHENLYTKPSLILIFIAEVRCFIYVEMYMILTGSSYWRDCSNREGVFIDRGCRKDYGNLITMRNLAVYQEVFVYVDLLLYTN